MIGFIRKNLLWFVLGLLIVALIIVVVLASQPGKTGMRFTAVPANTPDSAADLSADSDQDGLEDNIEDQLGTDKTNADTDGDGLPDGLEVYDLSYDPLKQDTDDNGTNDGDEDFDADGLANIYEIRNGIDLLLADMDYDGLNDGTETNETLTLPDDEDTDDDTLTDGEETALGFDPLNPDSDGDGIADGEEKIQQSADFEDIGQSAFTKVSVSFDGTGFIENTTSISSLPDEDPVSDVPGIVGNPIEINTSSVFDTAVVTVSYDESAVADEGSLSVLHFDDANGTFEVMGCTVDKGNNTVAFETAHFSVFLVVDGKVWSGTWRDAIDYRGGTQEPSNFYDVMLALDCSDSMNESDPQFLRKEAAINFINSLLDNDGAGVIYFNDSPSLICPVTDDKNAAISAAQNIFSSGMTDISSTIAMGVGQLQGEADGRQKIMILLTDGKHTVGDYDQGPAQRAKDAGIVIYTIGLGSEADEALLREIAGETGGMYYKLEQINELGDVFERVTEDFIDKTDTDGDGLYDVWETNGMRNQYGKVCFTDPLNTDTDGDGLPDGQEVADQFEGTDTNGDKYAVFVFSSYPDRDDSDFDGISDARDTKLLDTGSEVKLRNGEYGYTYTQNYSYCDSWFFKPSAEYNKELSRTSIILSSLISEDYKIDTGGGGEDIREFLESRGFGAFDIFKFNGEAGIGELSTTTYALATKIVKTEGPGGGIVSKPLIVVVVMGTNGYSEWQDNFDPGGDNEKEYVENVINDSGGFCMHKGFYIASEGVLEGIDNYIGKAYRKYMLDTAGNASAQPTFLVCGHSRGGSIANITAAMLTDRYGASNVYGYTFAAAKVGKIPDDVKDVYTNIFNQIIVNDFVTNVPPLSWSFERYGIDMLNDTYGKDASRFRAKFKSKVHEDYKCMAGTGDDPSIEWLNGLFESVAATPKQYYEEIKYNKRFSSDTRMSCKDLMFDIAKVIAHKMGGPAFAADDVPDELEALKWFIIFNKGKIFHPHYCESYIIVTELR